MAAKKKKAEGTPESINALGAAMDAAGVGAETPKKRGRKQPDLPAIEGPGVGKEIHEDIEQNADEYCDLRDRRIKLGISEKESKARLLGSMKSHDLLVYEYDGKVVTRKPRDETETVKVKVKDDVEVEDADGEGDE